MKLDLESAAGKQIIHAYETGIVIINGVTYRNHLMVSPDRIISPWETGEFVDLTSQHFDAILPSKPELILLGTGTRFHIPSAKLRTDLYQLGIALEFMDTQAACRTYNILALENRRVVAALII